MSGFLFLVVPGRSLGITFGTFFAPFWHPVGTNWAHFGTKGSPSAPQSLSKVAQRLSKGTPKEPRGALKRDTETWKPYFLIFDAAPTRNACFFESRGSLSEPFGIFSGSFGPAWDTKAPQMHSKVTPRWHRALQKALQRTSRDHKKTVTKTWNPLLSPAAHRCW